MIRCAIPCGLAVILISFIVDFFYYGAPTLCLWNFGKFNLLQGGSAHFGANVWFWYFINGLPSVFTMQCLPLLTLLVKKLWISPVSSATGFSVGAKLCRKELPIRYFWASLLCDCSLVDSSQRTSISASSYSIDNALFVVEMNDFLNASANFNVPNGFLILSSA
uniref:Mannosyltransferase n=1 Tax=Ditylenchus dipsaci TaxID=166011 RepID=A0A915DXW9_9BILA